MSYRRFKTNYVRNPNSITDKIENTGLNYERGEVVCLRFKGKEISGNDRIMMLQGDRTIDKREYDADMSVLMDKEYPKEKIDNLEDKNMKISYTDLDNHTYISEIQREPRDLTLMQKQIMLKELETINQNEKKIWNSDLPIEDKAREMIKINNKRIEVFKKYGISVPNIELEIKADNDISKKVLEDNKNVDDDADGRDPRDPIEILNHR